MAAERFDLSTAQAGYVSTAFDWVGFVGVLCAGWLSDRLDSRVRVIALMSVGLLGATTLMWTSGASSVFVFVVLLGLIGFMEMGPDSLLSGVGAIESGSRQRAALAAGIINGCGSLGPIVQEPVVGFLKKTYGPDAVWLLLIGVTAAATVGVAVFWYGVRRAGVKL
jgi:sugar phosphate permease